MKPALKRLLSRLSRIPRRPVSPAAVSFSGDLLDLWLPRLWPQQPGTVRWQLRPARGERQSGTVTDLAQLPPEARAARVRVWTSATETLLLRTQLPTRSRSKILQALPFALEDQILGAPEDQYFAYVPAGGGELAVAVTERSKVRAWLDALKAAGLHPVSLAPAMLALPTFPSAWTAAFIGEEFVLRSGTHAGTGSMTGSAPPATLAALLHEASTDGPAPEKILVFDAPPNFAFAEWGETLGVPVEAADRPLDEALPAVIPGFHLLQGEFAPRGEWRGLMRPYWPAAALFVLWLVSAFVADATEWWSLSRQHNTMRGEMEKVLKASFPETKTILDPAQQMQRGLEALRSRRGAASGEDLLPLLSRIAPAVQADGRSRLQGLAYADKTLTLSLLMPDDAAVENLRRLLANARLAVETQNVMRQGTQVEVKLRVRAAPAAEARTS